MNIQFVSDLHLEIPRNAQYFQKEKVIPFADILILAGDTMCWDEGYLQNPFWDEISSTFAQVLVIPGNHEFYKGYDLASLRKSASGIIRDNIHWYYNQLTIDKYNDENRFCRDYISKELEKKYSKRIIVSHHVPILEAISEQLQNSWYPALYANNLDELIRDNTIDYWIYGHSHQCRKSYRLHDTELVTNPCGYISKKENSQFDSNSIISI